MTYVLAKQLKDAGFPQEKRAGGFLCAHGGHTPTPDDCWDKVYYPTLSELVWAVQGYIFSLEWHSTNSLPPEIAPADKQWWEANDEFTGNSPEEAVARLWLSIRKDK